MSDYRRTQVHCFQVEFDRVPFCWCRFCFGSFVQMTFLRTHRVCDFLQDFFIVTKSRESIQFTFRAPKNKRQSRAKNIGTRKQSKERQGVHDSSRTPPKTVLRVPNSLRSTDIVKLNLQTSFLESGGKKGLPISYGPLRKRTRPNPGDERGPVQCHRSGRDVRVRGLKALTVREVSTSSSFGWDSPSLSQTRSSLPSFSRIT